MASNFVQSVMSLKTCYARLAAARTNARGEEGQAELDAAADAADNLEADILSHWPRSLDEAIVIAELVADSMTCGLRSDGLDVEAMRRVIICARDAAASQAPIASAERSAA